MALAALFPRPEAPLQAGLFSLTVVFSYVVYGFVWFWIPHQANWGNTLGITLMAVATTYFIPWGYTLRVWWRLRRHPQNPITPSPRREATAGRGQGMA